MQKYGERFSAVAEDEMMLAGDDGVVRDVGLLYEGEAPVSTMDVDSGVDCTSVDREDATGCGERYVSLHGRVFGRVSLTCNRPTHHHTPIKILVGPEEFTLPNADLTKHSTYFASLLAFEPIDDNEQQVVFLQDVSPELFTLFDISKCDN